MHCQSTVLPVSHNVERLAVSLASGIAEVTFQGLEPGRTYRVMTTDPDHVHFLTENDVVLESSIIQVSGSSPSIRIQVDEYTESYLSIACDDCGQASERQGRASVIQIDDDRTVEDLVRNVFIGGECYDIQNITFRGEDAMFGAFSGGDMSIGMESGMVMSTGRVDSIPGPNASASTATIFGSFQDEPDLDMLADGNDLYDVATIEFDFIPTDDTVSFRYVFASEEYCEYNFSSFNDKFGFFISGPGINGPFSNNAENVALIPGSNTEVSINTVNMSLNGEYYVDNVPQGGVFFGEWDCEPDTAVNGVALDYITYDGFTVVLTAKVAVQICEQYHIKLAIADQTDGSYDSAVFFERGSFNSGGTIEVEIEYARESDTLLYEGCNDGFIRFNRIAASDLSMPGQVEFTISPLSTAQEGIDYTGLVSPIIIPAGDTSVNVPINIINDGIVEGPESIILQISNTCRCESSEVVILIDDLDPLMVSLSDTSLCSTSTYTIMPSVSGGLGPYSYLWNGGDTAASLTVVPTETSSYHVMVTDQCGNTLADTMRLSFEPIEASMQSTELGCEGTSATITLSVMNMQPSWNIEWMDPDQNAFTPPSTSQFDVTREGWYTVRIEDPISNCFFVDSVEVPSVAVIPNVVASPDAMIACDPVDLSATSDVGDVTWNWTTLDGMIDSGTDQPMISITQAGTYIVTATSTSTNCIGRDTVIVTAIPRLTYTFDLNAPTCSDSLGGISFSPVAPSPAFGVELNGIRYESDVIIQVPPGNFTFQLITMGNCTTEVPITMPAPVPLQVQFDPDRLTNLDRGRPIDLQPLINISTDAIAMVIYSPDTFLNSPQLLNPVATPFAPITYLLTVTDSNGCVDSATIHLELNQRVNYFMPNAFSPNDDNINDYFTVFSDETITEILNLQVFNRWGDKVFGRQNFPPNEILLGWNGFVNSKAAIEGVYVYQGELRTVYDTTVKIKGEFILLR